MLQIFSIELDNFRGIRHWKSQSWTGAAFLVGDNGKGKSTVLDAIRAILVGRVTDALGKTIPLRELIGRHGKEANARIFTNLASLTLNISTKSSKLTATDENGEVIWGSGNDEIRAALFRAAVLNPAHVDITLNPLAYLLDPKEGIGAVLAGMNNSHISQETLFDYAEKRAEWLSGFMQRNNLLPVNVEDCDRLGKLAYDIRADANAESKQIEAQLAEYRAVTEPLTANGKKLTAADIAGAHASLDKLYKKRDALLSDSGGTRTAEVLEAARSVARAGVVRHQQQYDEAEAALQSVQDSRRGVQLQQRELYNQRSALSAELLTSQCDLRHVSQSGDKCPSCGRKYAKDHLAKVKTDLARAQQTIADIERRIAVIDAEVAVLAEPCSKDAQAKVATTYRALADHKSALASLESEKPKADHSAEITEIGASIERGQAALNTLAKLQHREDLEARFKTLLHERTNLDWAVIAFKDGAFQKSLTNTALDEFVATANGTLQAFGYTLAVDVNGKSSRLTLNGIPASQISEGERLLVQLGIAAGFARGGIVLLDDLNHLDGHKKGKFIRGIQALCAGTVVIAGAWGLPSDPNLESLAESMKPVTVEWMA